MRVNRGNEFKMLITEKEALNLSDAADIICGYCETAYGRDDAVCENCRVIKVAEFIEVAHECEKCGSRMEYHAHHSGEFEFCGKHYKTDDIPAWVCPKCQNTTYPVEGIIEFIKRL